MPDTLAWFHCFAGVAGDMALGSLVDAGADLDEVRDLLTRVPIGGWSIEARPTMRNGIGATRVVVSTHDDTVVRTFAHITGLLEEARLPERVRSRALRTFTALATAEAHLHRRPVDQVHFHEVGGVDAVIDIVGTAAALEVLGVDRIACSPVTNGMGVVRTSHGILPNPSPAVVRLLAGAPTRGVDLPVELTTPTGAALVATLAERWGPLPDMVIEGTGFGAGTRELDDLPNLVQVVVGQAQRSGPAGQPLVLLEANVDDVTGETLAVTIAALLEAGAADAWVTPIVMKKGRPAHTVGALADPALVGPLTRVLATETGTLGVRGTPVERWPTPREDGEVEVEGLPVRVKVGAGRVKVEHDDALRAARKTGLPLREVVSRAEAAWRERIDDTVVVLPPADPDPGGAAS